MKNQTAAGNFTAGIYPIGLLSDYDQAIVGRSAGDGWIPNDAHDAQIRETLLEIALHFCCVNRARVEVAGMPLETWAATPGGTRRYPIPVRVVQMVRPVPDPPELPEKFMYRDLKAQIDAGVLPPMGAPSAVDHPQHYNLGAVECIDALESALGAEGFKGFCTGNALKYLWRWQAKAGVQDLEKAQWYVAKLIEGEGKKS